MVACLFGEDLLEPGDEGVYPLVAEEFGEGWDGTDADIADARRTIAQEI